MGDKHRGTWERVQELRKQRKRHNRYNEAGLFSSILFCAGCGSVMYQQRYQTDKRRLQEAHNMHLLNYRPGKLVGRELQAIYSNLVSLHKIDRRPPLDFPAEKQYTEGGSIIAKDYK